MPDPTDYDYPDDIERDKPVSPADQTADYYAQCGAGWDDDR